MTTQQELKAEIVRQTARLQFTTDPWVQKILRTSIADLVETYHRYPNKLLWVAEQKEEGSK